MAILRVQAIRKEINSKYYIGITHKWLTMQHVTINGSYPTFIPMRILFLAKKTLDKNHMKLDIDHFTSMML